MTKPPQIKIKLNLFDKIIEALGYITLIVFWLMTIVSFCSLPESIPLHYNAIGEADSYSQKTSIFLLPIIGTLLFTILTIINKSPENFNYNIKITEENALKQYIIATKMIRLLKVIVVAVFLMINYQTIQIAKENTSGLGIWFLPLVLSMIFIPVGYYTFKSYQLKK